MGISAILFPSIHRVDIARDIENFVLFNPFTSFNLCAVSWRCDLRFTFNLAIVALTFKFFSGLYLGKHNL